MGEYVSMNANVAFLRFEKNGIITDVSSCVTNLTASTIVGIALLAPAVISKPSVVAPTSFEARLIHAIATSSSLSELHVSSESAQNAKKRP